MDYSAQTTDCLVRSQVQSKDKVQVSGVALASYISTSRFITALRLQACTPRAGGERLHKSWNFCSILPKCSRNVNDLRRPEIQNFPGGI